MAVQPNLVLGAAGAVLALITASYVGANWRSLTELSDWEANFSSADIVLPTRYASLGEGAKRAEIHDIVHENVTVLLAELTWRDPGGLASPPDVTLKILDPSGQTKAVGTHRGGAAGIQLEVELVRPDEVPQGSEPFTARGGDQAKTLFEERWPAHPESVGNWTFEISSKPSGQGVGAASISYTLEADYDYYWGTYRQVPTLVK